MITNYGDDDEGYKRFLAFLASSPNHEEEKAEAAAAVAPASSSKSKLILTVSTSQLDKSVLSLPMEVASLSSFKSNAQATKPSEEEEEKKDSADELISTSEQLEKATLIGARDDGGRKASDPGERRLSTSRRLSMQRSSMTMAQSMTTLSSLKTAAVERPPRDGQHPDYPFENVVFQGGGAKGTIYVGAIQALEELGILPYLKRFAGASAGSAAALSLALGLSAGQAKVEMDDMDTHGFLDGGSSKISNVRNISKRLGMHPGDKILEHFGRMIEKYTGDSDLTFLGLYQKFGTELCISVSNLSRSQGEFMHITTTPELPIKYALRASMSIPVVFEPMSMSDKGHGMHLGDLYVDGALFDNFPVNAFDGWFLKAGPDGSFHDQVLKLNPKLLEDDASAVDGVKIFRESLASSYAEPNQATIGFRITNSCDPDNFAYSAFLSGLEKKLGTDSSNSLELETQTQTNKKVEIDLPATKLAQAYLKKTKWERHVVKNQEEYEKAFAEFCLWFLRHSYLLQSHRVQGKYPPQAIPTHALLELLKESPPGKEFSYEVLGLESWEDFAYGIDIGAKGYFTKTDINMYWENYGIRDVHMKNRESTSIKGLGSFLQGIVWAPIKSNEEQILRDPANAARCCVLDTKYVGTMDLDLEQGDKEFLYEMGRLETRRWMKKRADELISIVTASPVV